MESWDCFLNVCWFSLACVGSLSKTDPSPLLKAVNPAGENANLASGYFSAKVCCAFCVKPATFHLQPFLPEGLVKTLAVLSISF